MVCPCQNTNCSHEANLVIYNEEYVFESDDLMGRKILIKSPTGRTGAVGKGHVVNIQIDGADDSDYYVKFEGIMLENGISVIFTDAVSGGRISGKINSREYFSQSNMVGTKQAKPIKEKKKVGWLQWFKNKFGKMSVGQGLAYWSLFLVGIFGSAVVLKMLFWTASGNSSPSVTIQSVTPTAK